MTEEPVEIDESHTASPIMPEESPAVLETLLESTPGPDQSHLWDWPIAQE